MKNIFVITIILLFFTLSPTKEENKNSSQIEEDDIDYSQKFNLTIDEMDKMLLCSIFIQKALSKDKDRIEALINKTNISESDSYLVFDKIGADIFERCYKDIDIKTVRKYFYNLSSVGDLEWDEKYDKYVEIDYDKYLNKSNFTLTEEQQMLSIKFNSIKKRLNEKQKEDKERKEKMKDELYKVKIGNFDIDNIPTNIKGFFFVFIFALIFIGSIKQKKKKSE